MTGTGKGYIHYAGFRQPVSENRTPLLIVPVAPPVLAKRRKAGKAARKARRTNR